MEMKKVQGHWKSEWKRRVKYFEKAVGKEEKETKSKPWHASYWNPFKKAKKKQDTDMEKVFGKLDELYGNFGIIATKAEIDAFEKAVNTAEKAGSQYVLKSLHSLTKTEVFSKMDEKDKKLHKQQVMRLTQILEQDVEALIGMARIDITRKRAFDKMPPELKAKAAQSDGMAIALMAQLSNMDPKVWKMGVLGNVKRSLAWLAKEMREPDAKSFNLGIKDCCRNVTQQLSNAERVFVAPKDKKVFKAARKILQPFGNEGLKIPEGQNDKVIAVGAKIEKCLQDTAKWAEAIKA